MIAKKGDNHVILRQHNRWMHGDPCPFNTGAHTTLDATFPLVVETK